MSSDGDEPAPAAVWARARERYEHGVEALAVIAAEAGITRQALVVRARNEGWKLRGLLPLGPLVAEVMAGYGLGDVDVASVEGLVAGFLIDRVMSGRDALEALMTAMGIDAVESGGRLRVFMRGKANVVPMSADQLAEAAAEAPLYRITRVQETELPQTIKLSYVEAVGAVVQAVAALTHGLAATGLAIVPAAVRRVTSAAFDATAANAVIGLSLNAGTAAAWSVSLVQAQLENLA